MRIIIERDAGAVARAAAAWVAKQVRQKPDSVLGLPTGSTALLLYDELVRLHQRERLDFSQVESFNLDEYVGLEAEHPHSFASFMRQHLFGPLNFDPAHVHLPDGTARDLEAECARYERAIRDAGGIDLQVLGLGASGHIAFNEPGSSLASRTRVKTLTRETRARNASHFDGPEQVPQLAITMGVGTILSARSCLLLACGKEKAAAIRNSVEGPVSAQVPASALQLHADVVTLIDEPAASALERRDYYHETEQAQRRLEAAGHAQRLVR